MGEEGQDGWCVLWLTLGPPAPGMELYWWYGGRGGSVSTSRIRSWCSQGLGGALRGCFRDVAAGKGEDVGKVEVWSWEWWWVFTN